MDRSANSKSNLRLGLAGGRSWDKTLFRVAVPLPWEVKELQGTFPVHFYYDGIRICSAEISVTDKEASATLTMPPWDTSEQFVLNSALHTIVAFVTCLPSAESISTEVCLTPNRVLADTERETISAWGFSMGEGPLSRVVRTSRELRQIKKGLTALSTSSPHLGRGFLVDVSQVSPESLRLLSADYSEVAWGRTHWVRNEAMAPDEEDVITRFTAGERTLEVGCGSGRLTKPLFDRASSGCEIWATDIEPSVLMNLQAGSLLPREVRLVQDDIVNSRLPIGTFDTVLFLENGLGSVYPEANRAQALANMASLLRPGGRVVLGIRSLPQSPVDQLMIAAQSPLVMAVYHTFSVDEVCGLAPKTLHVDEVIEGEGRTAGGIARFVVFRRVE